MSQPQPIQQPGSSTWRQPWVLVLIAAIIVAISIALIVDATSTSTPAKTPSGNPAAAERTCRASVEDRLKSPASAKFGNPDTTFAAGDTADFYTVTGTVDSQNGFGAMLRSTYRCQLTAERDGTWRLTDLTVRQRR